MADFDHTNATPTAIAPRIVTNGDRSALLSEADRAAEVPREVFAPGAAADEERRERLPEPLRLEDVLPDFEVRAWEELLRLDDREPPREVCERDVRVAMLAHYPPSASAAVRLRPCRGEFE